MATSSSDKIIAEIAERITERRRLYDACFTGDLDRLRARFGPGPVLEALQHLKQGPPRPSKFEARAHRAEVSRAIAALLERKARDPELFADDGVKI
jgi:hypothetical protein